MKRILTTTALALVLATPLAAASRDTADWSTTFQDVAGENQIHASDFIGSRVYVSTADVGDQAVNEADDNWEDVGEINDVLMSPDGQIETILVDVGGFLGIGEKTVAVQMDRLHLVSDGDSPNDYFVVFTSSREALENAPEFKEDTHRTDMTEGDKAATDTAMADKKTTQQDDSVAGKASISRADEKPPEDQRTMGAYPAAPDVQIEGYGTVKVTDLTVDDLTGATVYDVNNKNIGEVSVLIVDTDGKITDAVIDVGGFLGMGEKPVKVSFDSLALKRADQGDEIRVYIDATEDQLKELPEYKKS